MNLLFILKKNSLKKFGHLNLKNFNLIRKLTSSGNYLNNILLTTE